MNFQPQLSTNKKRIWIIRNESSTTNEYKYKKNLDYLVYIKKYLVHNLKK